MKPGNVLAQLIDGEMVVLNLDNENYFTFDQVATRFWEVVTEHGHGEEAVRVLLDEYDVERSTLSADLDRWVSKMLELELLIQESKDA